MNLEYAHLGHAYQALNGVQGQKFLFHTGFTIPDRDTLYAGRQSATHVFLKEAGLFATFRAADQTERPICHMR